MIVDMIATTSGKSSGCDQTSSPDAVLLVSTQVGKCKMWCSCSVGLLRGDPKAAVCL